MAGVLPLGWVVLVVCLSGFAGAGDLNKELEITWGGHRAKFEDGGKMLTVLLDKSSGSGFASRNQYLFGKIDMQIKLVHGNSAGTVTAYFLRSHDSKWDEIDFEFLGNLSGEPYIVHTNVYTEGKGDREQQFYLWFDPRADFHTYSFLWNPINIIFYVDGIPIREYKNKESEGIPYPKKKPMRLQSSLWNADDWATRGGQVKTDWSLAPFIASYRDYNADRACVWPSPCKSGSWISQKLGPAGYRKLKWVRKNYMIYDYCSDFKRFPGGLPPECTH